MTLEFAKRFLLFLLWAQWCNIEYDIEQSMDGWMEGTDERGTKRVKLHLVCSRKERLSFLWLFFNLFFFCTTPTQQCAYSIHVQKYQQPAVAEGWLLSIVVVAQLRAKGGITLSYCVFIRELESWPWSYCGTQESKTCSLGHRFTIYAETMDGKRRWGGPAAIIQTRGMINIESSNSSCKAKSSNPASPQLLLLFAQYFVGLAVCHERVK